MLKCFWRKNLLIYGLLQFVGVVYYVVCLMRQGFLPAPFIADKYDTFMDFFHAMYWAIHEGRYDVWQSVYPPINFIFLSIVNYISIPVGNYPSGFSLRENGLWSIVLFFVISIVLSFCVIKFRSWKSVSPRERLLILAAYFMGTPFLFAIERGNLIVYSVIFISMAMSGVPILRILAVAFLVNLKPYFAVIYFLYIAKRKMGELLISLFAAGALYVFSGVMLGSDPLAIPRNLLVFSNVMPFSPGAVMTGMLSSVSAYSFVSDFVVEHSIGILSGKFVLLCADAAKYANMVIILSAFATMFLRGDSLKSSFVLLIIFCIITNMSITVGAYTLVFYFPLIPVILERRYAKVLLIMVAIIFLPLDIVKYTSSSTVEQISYLSGSSVQVPAEVGLGALLRPVLNLAILALLTFEAATTARPAPGTAGEEGSDFRAVEQV